jgi:antitoxin YefM
MSTVTASDARSRLYRLIDEAADSHQPVVITGKRTNAVLISEEDWDAIQETLYLTGIPGMRDSIKAGMKTPVSKLRRKLRW